MSWPFWLIASLVFLAGSAFFSGTEMGLYCVNRLRARLAAGRHPRLPDRALWWMIRHPQQSVIATLLGNQLANYLLTVSATALAVEAFGLSAARTKFYMAAVLSPLVFVFGDVVPKNWFQLDTDRLMRRSAPLLGACVLVLRATGILWLLTRLTDLLIRLTGYGTLKDLDSPRAEVVGLLREGGAGGPLTAEQAQIIERVMNLSEVALGSIMVPRRRIVAVPIEADRPTLERVIEEHPFSHLPVTGPDRHDFVGVVDVLDVLADENAQPVGRHLQPVITLEASESAAAALVRLQKAESAMAVVRDPRHGVVGLVTLRDVMEEIFGELPA